MTMIFKDSIGNFRLELLGTKYYYETKVRSNGEKDYYINMPRDDHGAEVLYSILKNDSTARMIVHVGYGHLNKYMPQIANKVWMQLKQNIFCIDQTTNLEYYNNTYKNESVKEICNTIKVPSILFKKSDSTLITNYYSNNVDVTIFHPSTKYIHNRPDWFINRPDKTIVPLKKLPIKLKTFPSLVMSYNKNEYDKYGDNCVAEDVIEVSSKKEDIVMALPKSKTQVILVRDANNNIKKYIYEPK